MKIRRERHRVWSLSYHAVFVVKYRKPCITDEIADFLLDEMRHLLESWGGELIEGKADRDHLHLLFSLPPDKVRNRKPRLYKSRDSLICSFNPVCSFDSPACSADSVLFLTLTLFFNSA